MRLERVVIGMDFSQRAIAAAAWTARHFAPGAELVLVHAIVVPEIPRFLRARMPPADTLIETARLGAAQRIRGLAVSLGAKLVWPEIAVGPAAEQIAEACRAHGADLIVVGPPGERPDGWGGRVDSTVEQLARLAPVPLLLAAHIAEAAPRRLLIAVDDSHVAPFVLRWASFLVERFDARATAIHVLGAPASTTGLFAATLGSGGIWPVQERAWTDAREDAERWLRRAVADTGADERIATEVIFGDPREEIVTAAQRTGADLLVIGSRGLAGLPRMLLGSVASHVLRHASCPTLVVKEPEDELVVHG